jgi:hypothetical protein
MEAPVMRRLFLLVSVVVFVREAMPVTKPWVVAAAFIVAMRGVLTMSGLIQGLKLDDEDTPSRFQNAPDFADGSLESLGCQVVHDQAADDDIYRGIRKR